MPAHTWKDDLQIKRPDTELLAKKQYRNGAWLIFRRSLWNPEVLTYDELLDRARFLVEQAKPVEPPTEEDNGIPAWLR